MSKACGWCEWPEDAIFGCRSRSSGDSGYACSRHEGHDGPHVACGTVKHGLANWGPAMSGLEAIDNRERLDRIAAEARAELDRIEQYGGEAGFAMRILAIVEGSDG